MENEKKTNKKTREGVLKRENLTLPPCVGRPRDGAYQRSTPTTLPLRHASHLALDGAPKRRSRYRSWADCATGATPLALQETHQPKWQENQRE